ncbi:hypothetical protein [Nocardia sp. NBC_01388]|uniref:hypothetical protein n=1 Tax=Nocardia sp. NBC_01388 TaxID=2903596 RepID=UPI003255E692
MPKFAAILARRAATAARAAVARAAATPRGRKMITKARMFAAPAECMARNGLSTTTALRTGALTTITPVLAAIDPTGELELATRFSSPAGRAVTEAFRALNDGDEPRTAWKVADTGYPIEVKVYNLDSSRDRQALGDGLTHYKRTAQALIALAAG